jgi:spermidine synthase
MSGSLERRDDGSVALFISGDLQFDSRDERIYHEALALPALALSLARTQSSLRVLVIGGGDGLIARELFKSDRVASVDLVDFDPQILAMANSELSGLNASSLTDARMQIHVQDAWVFCEESLNLGKQYDLIVCDLTVPEDLSGARFHTCDWYEKLHRLLTPSGVVAVNACSPHATPRAFCSVFNSLLRAKFDARPLHVSLPSFTERGYGDDWGFFVASPRAIDAGEFEDSFESLKPRQWLEDLTMLLHLFEFPQELFEQRNSVVPSAVGSDILLSYFYNDKTLVPSSGVFLNALNLDIATMYVPEPDRGTTLLPAHVSQALVQCLRSQFDTPEADSPLIDNVQKDVLALIPALYRDHTPRILGEFLNDPAAFLRGLDLRALVNALLQRAQELPSQLVAELKLLRDKLDTWMDDNLTVLSLGHRVLTILSLVVVLGNLLYPDMVYAKGGAHTASVSHAAGRGAAGRKGGRSYGRGWGGGYGGGYYGTNYVRRPRVINRGAIGPADGPPSKGVQINNYGPSRKSLPNQGSLPGAKGSISMQVTTGGAAGPDGIGSADTNKELRRIHSRLQSREKDLCEYADVLRRELLAYQSATDPLVIFGTHSIPVQDAINRTITAIAPIDEQEKA